MPDRPEFRAYFPTGKNGTLTPARYDQDTSDDHRKENHGWLPHRIGRARQRGKGMGHVFRGRAAQRRHRPMSIPDAIRAAAPRPVLIIAGRASADEPAAARWFQAASPPAAQVRVVPHAGHTQGLATAPRAWKPTSSAS
jgi:pimeloyl-ACP methyl ester carboxylesterase